MLLTGGRLRHKAPGLDHTVRSWQRWGQQPVSAVVPLCPCTPATCPMEPRGRAGSVGRWNEEEAVFAAELLLTSQTLLFASVGSLPLLVPDNLFLCLPAYI